MKRYKDGPDICDSCTRRRCKLRPEKNKCTKYAPAKSGWKMEEVFYEKGS